jgi:bifunctional enzyme CysN/CysC/sulfate adenylyltransferase subunit 1
VDWSEARFTEIRDAVEDFLPKLNAFKDVKFIPMSALNGDNVVDPSQHTPWYGGPTLLNHLETVHIASDWNLSALRFPVQWVNRPNNPTDHSLHDFRGLSGQLASGVVRVGQKIMALPSGLKSTVKEIWTYDGKLSEAFCPQSVTLVLEHDLDISRGDTLVGLENLPGMASDLTAKICWMHQRPLQMGNKYFLKHGSQSVQCRIGSIEHRVNIENFEHESMPGDLPLNGIGEVKIKTAKPIVYDGYSTNRLTGSFILIEQGTNQTVGAGMLLPPIEAVKPEYNDFAI